jgi:RNA polymerase sigma-70 factor (ECF subfamily)
VTDEEIALSVQQGDSEALAYLVERHQSRLIGYLYLMLGGDRRQAEDLTQEAFLRAMRAIESYTYPRPFKPWLYAIAINLAHNHHNRAETRYPTAGDDVLDGLQDEADPVETKVAQHGEIDRMLTLLGKLPVQQHEAVILRYVEGLSLAEIGEVLHVPVGTVKSRISLGLSRLRALMQENNEL